MSDESRRVLELDGKATAGPWCFYQSLVDDGWCGQDANLVDEYRTLAPQLARQVEALEDELFKRGAMNGAPCFCCGYNGPGYYQPDSHPCAERHHRLYSPEES